MYGVINKAIEEYVTDKFGAESWENIKEKSGVTVDLSVMEQPYNDDVTHALAMAVAQETGQPLQEVLNMFGEYVIKTTSKRFSGILESRGNNLRDYLINLPNFHNRIMLIYPELTPPEFRVSHIQEKSLYLHYVAKREGMNDFIKGYLTGLSDIFNETVTIEPVPNNAEGSPQEVFKISW